MIGCIIILLILGVLFWCLFPKSEGYNTLGALGPYKEELYKCLSICEREDPRNFLGNTKGSLFCEMACYSELSKKAQNHVPPQSVNTYGSCVSEVLERCKQDCPYSLSSPELCMRDCALSLAPNCNMVSWTWK